MHYLHPFFLLRDLLGARKMGCFSVVKYDKINKGLLHKKERLSSLVACTVDFKKSHWFKVCLDSSLTSLTNQRTLVCLTKEDLNWKE